MLDEYFKSRWTFQHFLRHYILALLKIGFFFSAKTAYHVEWQHKLIGNPQSLILCGKRAATNNLHGADFLSALSTWDKFHISTPGKSGKSTYCLVDAMPRLQTGGRGCRHLLFTCTNVVLLYGADWASLKQVTESAMESDRSCSEILEQLIICQSAGTVAWKLQDLTSHHQSKLQHVSVNLNLTTKSSG